MEIGTKCKTIGNHSKMGAILFDFQWFSFGNPNFKTIGIPMLLVFQYLVFKIHTGNFQGCFQYEKYGQMDGRMDLKTGCMALLQQQSVTV